MATWTAGTMPIVWRQWTTAASTTGGYTWDQWINTGTCSTTTTTIQTNVWQQWERDWEVRPETPDELQQRREAAARIRLERERAQQQRAEERAEAARCAKILLEEVVAAEDWIPALGMIQVQGTDGETYRIEMHRDTVHGNIVRVDEHGCMLARACVAPGMYDGAEILPTADGWVGQYLGLKFDTEQFLAHANWSNLRPCHEAA